ncbi:MAG: hypothetical protein COA79_23330 [Planctomycetota bacterium]|nr:MAG: hypothetical protein COA79_23330 [Planctomycetota bacterium]
MYESANNSNDDRSTDQELYQDEEEHSLKAAAAPAWIISILVHAVLIASLLYMLMPRENKIKDTIITTSVLPPVEEPVEEKEIDVIKVKTEVKVEVEVEVPPIITEEEVTDELETENDVEAETAEGISEAISDMPLVGESISANIGGGGPSGGAFGSRSPGGRKKAVISGSATRKTESAVDAGLWWLAHHQEADGHWDTGKYEGAGTPEVDSACTAAALLAFLGAGHTDRVGKWKKNVKVGIKWLIECQRPNGAFDSRNYSNGMCTMAIAEAAGMGAGGSEAKKAAELAVDYLIKEQNAKGGFNYTGPTSRDDMSVTGWCVMGLKSAMVSGIREHDIKDVFKKVGELMNHNENATTTGDNTSTTKGMAWYTSGKSASNSSAVGAIAMLTRQYLGWQRGEPWLEAASAGQVSKLPGNFENMNVYRVYYAYLTLFQQGGAKWKAWNKPVSDIIVQAQRTDGDFKGSWDNNGKGHMTKGGRVLTTAFLVLSLEVYYRYKSVMGSGH